MKSFYKGFTRINYNVISAFALMAKLFEFTDIYTNSDNFIVEKS